MEPLRGKVAVVAGATRGAGRGIARVLGAAGATVYCTGRSGGSARSPVGRPETVEETAAMVSAAGGVGIPVRVDHAEEGEVEALMRRVREEREGPDLLVNVLGGRSVRAWEPFWELEVREGREVFDSWLWPHLVTARHAAALMAERGRGLIVEIGESPSLAYLGQLYWDLARVALARLSYALAVELAPRGVTALTVVPGFMRTEAVLATLGATEQSWREVAEASPDARRYGLAGSESPHFVGRAVAALAADPGVASKSGGIFPTWELAEEYGFTDEDGSRPHWARFFAETFGSRYGETKASVRWEVRGAG